MTSKRVPFHRSLVSRLVCGLAMTVVLTAPIGCGDKGDGGDAKGDDAKDDTASLAAEVDREVAQMKAELDKGEDIKYSCAGNLAQYEALATSAKADEKKAYEAMSQLCWVDGPKKMLADLRAKMAKGELDTLDTVDLQTTLEDEKFPKTEEAAKVAADGKKFLNVEVPTSELNKHLDEASKEKEAGETVSMGCITAKQVVDEHGKDLEGDEQGKVALAAFTEACPQDDDEKAE